MKTDEEIVAAALQAVRESHGPPTIGMAYLAAQEVLRTKGKETLAKTLLSVGARCVSDIPAESVIRFIQDCTAICEAGSELNPRQKKAAAEMRAKRPMCVPGTDNIISRDEERVWWGQVATAALDVKLQGKQFNVWCDACGVQSDATKR